MAAETPLACRLEALPQGVRAKHSGLIEQLGGSLEEVRELPDGYAFRFAEDGFLFDRLAEWVRLESVCCPFLNFELRVERRAGPLWLRLTGPPGAKDFLRDQFPVRVAGRE